MSGIYLNKRIRDYSIAQGLGSGRNHLWYLLPCCHICGQHGPMRAKWNCSTAMRRFGPSIVLCSQFVSHTGITGLSNDLLDHIVKFASYLGVDNEGPVCGGALG